MNKPPLTREKAYQLAIQRGLISPEGEMSSKVPLSKEKAYELAIQRGLIKPEDNMGQSLARGAKNVLAGALDTADFLATPIREGINLGAKALGSEYQMQPMGQMTSNAIDKATHGYTKAHTPLQKIEESTQRALTSLPIGGTIAAGIKGAGNAAKGLQSFMQTSSEMTPVNIASTAGASGGAQHVLNNDPDNVLGAVGASLAGGITPQLGRGLTKAGRQIAHERLGKNIGDTIGFSPHALEDFERSGVTPLLSDVTSSKALKMGTNSLSKVPFAGKPIREAQSKQYKQILENLGQGDFGEGITQSEASKLATKGARGYQKQQNSIHSKMFNKIKEDLENISDKSITPHKTLDTFNKFTSHFKNQGQLDRFKKTPAGKIFDRFEELRYGKDGFNYDEAKELLDDINDMVTTHGSIGKSSQGRLKTVAQAIKDDIDISMESRFKELGKDSYVNWKAARSIYTDFAENDIPRLNEIYKNDKKGGAAAFLDLITNVKKGGKKASLSAQGLSDKDYTELMHTVNHKLGSARDGTFSPVIWATNFKALEPEAKKMILAPLGEYNAKKAMALTDTMDRMKETIAQANSSQTAYHNMMYDMGKRVVGSGLGLLTYTNPVMAVETLTGILAGRLGSNLLTNKKVINWLGDSMRAKNMKTFQRRLEVANKSKGMPQGFAHATNEMLRMMKEPPQATEDNHATGGAIRRGYAAGGSPRAASVDDVLMGMRSGGENGSDAITDLFNRNGLTMLSDEQNRYQQLLDMSKTMSPRNPRYNDLRKQLKSMQMQFLEDAKDAGVQDPTMSAYNSAQEQQQADQATRNAAALKENARFHVINGLNDEEHYSESNAALDPMKQSMKQATQLNRMVNSNEFKRLDPATQQQYLQYQQQANDQQKQYMDQYAGLENAEHDAESARQDQLDEERKQNEGWGIVKGIPVFGDIMKGINTITGGAMESAANAGAQFSHGNWKSGLGNLADSGIKAGQFVANPGQTTMQNVGGEVMQKYVMPKVAPYLPNMGGAQPQQQSDQSYQQQPTYRKGGRI